MAAEKQPDVPAAGSENITGTTAHEGDKELSAKSEKARGTFTGQPGLPAILTEDRYRIHTECCTPPATRQEAPGQSLQ